MAASDTEICNLAISHLGIAKEIANLETDPSAEAAACRRFYETARDQTLRDFIWPFATKFVALGLVATNPPEIDQEWTYSYRLPSDCLKFRRIISGIKPDTRQSRIPYQLAQDTQGLLVYSNQPNAEAEYTKRETDVSRFPADFVQALSLRLAAYAAPRLTGGDPFKLAGRALQLYEWEITRARASAANEQQEPEEPDSEFIRARGGGNAVSRLARGLED